MLLARQDHRHRATRQQGLENAQLHRQEPRATGSLKPWHRQKDRESVSELRQECKEAVARASKACGQVLFTLDLHPFSSFLSLYSWVSSMISCETAVSARTGRPQCLEGRLSPTAGAPLPTLRQPRVSKAGLAAVCF